MVSAAVLALALAQSAPSGSPLPAGEAASAASAVPAASPASSPASALPGRPPESGLPGRPSSGAAATMSDDPSLAVIVNSGSTNIAGYTLRVRPDGWTTLEQAGAVQRKRIEPALAARLFADLRAAGPMDALPRTMCMKSASFGSVTTVAYRGARSPDLSCPGSAGAQALGADVGAVRDAVGVARVPAHQLR